MGVFTNIILKLRLPILVTVTIVTTLLAFQLEHLSQDEDLLKFLPAEDPDILLFRQVSREFGGLDVAIVGIESPRLLTADGMAAVRRMTRAASAVDGVYHALSFTEVPHLTPSEEEFAIDPLVPEEIPREPEAIAEIRHNVLHDAIATGRLVSTDGNAARIMCFLEADVGQETVAEAIQEAVREEAGHMRLFYGGLPFVQAYIGGGTREDIIGLTPYVLFIAALATFIFFRRPLGSLLVLSSVALGTIWTIGGMAALGAQMTVISTSLPMVLVAIGGAYGAHVLAAYYVAQAPTAPQRVEIALREVGPPVLASMMTTVAGFASFLAMDVAPMRAFGFQASVGVFLCAILAMVVLPAALSFGRGKPIKPPAAKLARPITRLSLGARKHRVVTFVVVAIICAITGAMAWRVVPDTSMDSFFRPDSPPAEADRFLRERFGGSVFVQVYLRGDLRDPVVLDEMRSIVGEANTIEGVTDVNSFLQTLETLSAGLGGVQRIPRTRDQVSGIRPFMAGNPGLRQLVDDDLTRAMIQITVGTQDTRIVGAIVDHLDDFIDREIPDRLVTVDLRTSGPLQERAREYRLRSIAERVVRLMRANGLEPEVNADEAVFRVLRRHFGEWRLAAGDDLDRAIQQTVDNYFNSDDSPFDTFDASTAARASATIARSPVTADSLSSVLVSALPAEVAEDREGVEMAVPALVERISETRARVFASRFIDDVFQAAGVSQPENESQAFIAVRHALEEIDDWHVGVPTDGNDGLSIEAGVTGTPVINRAFGRSTQRNQIRSIVVSMVALLLLSVAMFRSLRLGFFAVLPAGVTLLITFGIMGWMHMPLDPGTCMVAALSLGIGIDYAIHFLWRRRWRGLSFRETCMTVGPAIIFNAVQVASGFGVMIVADTVPLSHFGILVTIAMVVAAAATFTVLPALERREEQGETQESSS